MRLVRCLCGQQVEAADADALRHAFLTHTSEAHAEIKADDARRRDVEEAILRTGGWDGRKIPIEGEVEIRPLTPGCRDDYLKFFDHDAFPDNPVFASCYCISYHLSLPPSDFDRRTAAKNRADRATMIERGEASGVLAYAQGEVIGWCNAAPRTALALLDLTPEFAAEDPATAGAIVCFVIAPQYRGQGVATLLLDGACEMLRDGGFRTVYAYPPQRAATDAGSYHGKLSMYLGSGFAETSAATRRYVVVRKSLV